MNISTITITGCFQGKIVTVVFLVSDFPQSATADLTPFKSGNIAGAAGNGRILVTNPTLLSMCLLVLACIAMIK